ncbi:hypothetical protein QOZ80_8BG0669100 [Eleusine coracana subsp. coracana]|nr:hypothetical protein QOZ80_8BG0669100 [Eleusine coracana subsp. coracana]
MLEQKQDDPISSESESEWWLSQEFAATKEMEWAEKVTREQYEKKLALGVDADHEVVRSSLVMESIGFLCSEGGAEFIMAELLLDRRNNRKVSAEISLLHSGTCEWVHMPGLPIQCNKYDSAALHCFCSQSTVPFGDCLCWVDYRTGIIIGKAMLEQTPNLSYIRFPRMNPSRLGDDLRSVCATDGGNSLKFIDIIVNNQPRSTGFTILVYKLITTEDGCMKWDKETSMTSTEMWELEAPGRIPHEAVPMFPLMSLDEPHIICFQLVECTDYIDTVTLVSIDMSARSVVSVFTHIKGEQELHGQDADVAEARTLLPLPFLPVTFSKSLISRPVNFRKRKDQS